MSKKMMVRTLLVCGALLISGRLATGQTATKRGKPADATLPIAVSGHEERLGAEIRYRVKAQEPKTDNLGNVYVTIRAGAPHKLIAVAMDEPGYVVSGITEDVYLRVQRLPQAAVTPVIDVLNFAQPVWVLTRSGKRVNAVFAGLSVHLQPGRLGGPKMNHPDELFVDVGAKNAAEVAAAGVDVLDAVATQRNLLPVGREEISGQSSGDRTALLAMLGLIEKARPNEIKGTLTVAFVAQHWTGGRGMNRLLTEVHPNEMIFVGHVAAGSPVDNPAGATAAVAQKLGSGVLIGTASTDGGAGDFVGELKALAETKQIPVTVVSANLPRIAGYVPGAEYPKRTVEIAMPTLWAETPAETVNRKDAANLFELLADYAGVHVNEEIKPEYSAYKNFPGAIEQLVTAYGASGHEAAVREKVKDLLPVWARKKTRTDDAGNLILHLGDERTTAKTPRLVFVAHMDEIGYEVKKIEDDGRVELAVLGGGYTQYFLGHTALLHKSDGSTAGAVMELP